jgi:hypothetical protein
MKDFDLASIQSSAQTGLDALFEQHPTLVTPTTGRRKLSSLQDLNGFVRVGSDTLVNKSQKDLWSLRKEGEDFYIERLFQDNGTPLKG